MKTLEHDGDQPDVVYQYVYSKHRTRKIEIKILKLKTKYS